jgi:hypothetical protein
MIRHKILVTGLLVSTWQSVPTMALAAPKAKDVNAAQKAMDECARAYCGIRSRSVRGARPMLMESCFRQKTGRFPAQMGMAIKVLHHCPG